MMPNVRRTSMNLDLELVERARAELGTNGTTDTVHRALEEVVRRAALGRLAAWHPDIDDIERFRDEAWGD
jgi:Arc/MetJ family transcription regulator